MSLCRDSLRDDRWWGKQPGGYRWGIGRVVHVIANHYVVGIQGMSLPSESSCHVTGGTAVKGVTWHTSSDL